MMHGDMDVCDVCIGMTNREFSLHCSGVSESIAPHMTTEKQQLPH